MKKDILKLHEDEEVELEVIPPVDYKKGAEEYKKQVISNAKKYGFELEFYEDIYPLRKSPVWYSGSFIYFSVKDTTIVGYINSYSEETSFYSNNEKIGGIEDFVEEYQIFTDKELYEAIDVGGIEIEDEGGFNWMLYDNSQQYESGVYSFDFNYSDTYYLDDALDFRVIAEFVKDFIESKKEKINEDKVGLENFKKKFGPELFDKFGKLKTRLKSPNNDISYWMKKTKEELVSVLDDLESKMTVKQKSELAKEGSKLIYADENWNVIEIYTLEASIKYGKGTQWCISGVNCDAPEHWKRYKENIPGFPKDDTIFIFFISKVYSDRYAVLFNKKTNDYLIWNDIDNPVAFILEAPRVKGLPNLGKIPEKLKKELASSLKVPVANIISIVNSYEVMYDGDHFEKYDVEYTDAKGVSRTIGLYRSPDTGKFIPFEYI